MDKIFPKVMDIRWRYDGEDDQYITYLNPKTNNISILNPVGAKIFTLSDGNHSIEDIIEEIYREFEVPSREIVRGDVEDFLNFMSKDGMIKLLEN